MLWFDQWLMLKQLSFDQNGCSNFHEQIISNWASLSYACLYLGFRRPKMNPGVLDILCASKWIQINFCGFWIISSPNLSLHLFLNTSQRSQRCSAPKEKSRYVQTKPPTNKYLSSIANEVESDKELPSINSYDLRPICSSSGWASFDLLQEEPISLRIHQQEARHVWNKYRYHLGCYPSQ